MKHLYIGIDPDVEKSGFAIWNKPEQRFEKITSLILPDLLDTIIELRESIALVVVESGFLNKSNWHLYRVPKKAKVKNPIAHAAKTGENTGRGHQRAMDIVELMEWLKIPYRLQKPLSPNTWKDDEKMFQKITGTKGGNSEKRDAAMLVFKM